MGLQEFPSKPVNKGGVVIGTINGPTEVAVGAQDSYLVADSTATPGAKWQTYRKYNTVQLTSGTSWTVPATVEMVDVLLIGGGAGGTTRTNSTSAGSFYSSNPGGPGAMLYTENYPVTPGATVTYAIGAGSNAPAASGVAATTTYPAAAGNTTFGLLVAPGCLNKVGNQNAWTYTNQSYIRGIYDFVTINNDFSAQSVTMTNRDPGAGGMPTGFNAWILGTRPTSSSGQTPFSHPQQGFQSSTSSLAIERPFGIDGQFSKLLSDYTEPQGTAAANETSGGTAGSTRLSGWGGYGGYGNDTTTQPYYNHAHHGAGSGAIMLSSNTSARQNAGGNAAANSGSGGGTGYGCSAGATPIAAATGGNGGSGVIFIGYWA
jgi:hypothetical protein